MTLKTPKIIMSLLTLLIFTLGIVYASNTVSQKENQPTLNYKQMSTAQLQKEVEKLANQDKLPFEMGLELMKRWSNKEEVEVH